MRTGACGARWPLKRSHYAGVALEIRRARPISPIVPQRLIPLDDLAAPFQIENEPVRGRLVRLGPAVDEILTRHDYPTAVANLLGETCALAALVGISLKFERQRPSHLTAVFAEHIRLTLPLL